MPPNSAKNDRPVNPNECLDIPKWVNVEYFQKILVQEIPNYVRVINFTPLAATQPGENYASIMVRVVIDIELKDSQIEQVSYILKTELDTGDTANLVNDMGLFPKEKQMYEVHIPTYTKLYKDAGVDIQLAPKCLHIEKTSERITLIMEDLQRKHFKNIDRLKGFDMAHMSRVLQKLAELHAASAVNYELNGPYDDMYNISFFTENKRKDFGDMTEMREESLHKAMRQWGLENVEEYIENTPEPMKCFDEALFVNNGDTNDFNVLNHGDCWSNNIMFNYKENGEIDETIFVDLQIAKWGSPAQDLWYMICTSVSLDIKVKEFDHFIQIYHKRLDECLKLLKYKKHIPSLKELHIMMYKYGYWGPLTSTGVMSIILYPSDKDIDINNMMKPGPEADEFRYKTFINPIYAKAMCQLMPFFKNRGLLLNK